MEHRDIFDIIMDWKIMKPFNPFYKKHREGLLYLLFGGLTFFFALAVYTILLSVFNVHELVSNAISWVCGVTFSFFTTKKWVFLNHNWKLKYVISQLISFFGARLATLFLQELLLYIFVTQLGFNAIGMKIITEIINIILNYLVSKFIIFKKKQNSKVG